MSGKDEEDREDPVPGDDVEPVPAEGDTLPADATDAAAEWRDKYLRSLAELDNYRKRMERERVQHRLYACEGLVKGMLDVLEDLQLACGAAGAGDRIAGGVALAIRKAMVALEESGVRPIEAMGKPFDPRFHEAMGAIPSADAAPGTVVVELRRGYQLHDRVVRPSRVQIAMAANDAPGADDDDRDGGRGSERDEE